MENHTSLFITLILTGLIGSLGHCIGMCGPLLIMINMRFRNEGSIVLRNLLYHGVRVAVYVLMGAVAGGIGSMVGFGTELKIMPNIISLVLGIIVIIIGIGYLGWLPGSFIDVSGSWIQKWMSRAVRLGGGTGAIILGALNGILPCGLVYSALITVASVGSVSAGMLGMLMFGSGTVPAMFVIGLGVNLLSVHLRRTLTIVAGIFIILVGFQLILRGMSGLGMLPHFHVAGLMFW